MRNTSYFSCRQEERSPDRLDASSSLRRLPAYSTSSRRFRLSAEAGASTPRSGRAADQLTMWRCCRWSSETPISRQGRRHPVYLRGSRFSELEIHKSKSADKNRNEVRDKYKIQCVVRIAFAICCDKMAAFRKHDYECTPAAFQIGTAPRAETDTRSIGIVFACGMERPIAKPVPLPQLPVKTCRPLQARAFGVQDASLKLRAAPRH